jgi:hypothetical protein
MRNLVAIAVLWMSFQAVAAAQSAEIGLSVGWSVLSNRSLGSLSDFEAGLQLANIDNGLRIGGRISSNRLFTGHEMSYSYQRTNLKIGGTRPEGMTVQNLYYNFVVHATPEGTIVRPFGTVGAGVSTFFPPGVSSLSGGGANKFGYNYGGGLKFKLNEKFGLRFDVRDHVTGKPFGLPNSSGRLHNTEYSTTFALLF